MRVLRVRLSMVAVILGLAVATLPAQTVSASNATQVRSAVTASQPFTVATYNVRRMNASGGPRWATRRTAAVKLLRRLNPDVLALQEAAAPAGKPFGTSPAAYLARKLGLKVAWANSLGGVQRQSPQRIFNGQYILYRPSRFEQTDGGNYRIRRGPDGRILAQYTHVRLTDLRTGRETNVSNTHLSHGSTDAADRVRAEEARSMLAVLKGYGINPATPNWVHVGDFNSHAGRGKNRPVKIFTRAGLVNALTIAQSSTQAKVNSFNGFRRKAKTQGRHLDYVWVPRGTQVSHWGQAVTIKRGHYVGRHGSDHNPIAATVLLPSL